MFRLTVRRKNLADLLRISLILGVFMLQAAAVQAGYCSSDPNRPCFTNYDCGAFCRTGPLAGNECYGYPFDCGGQCVNGTDAGQFCTSDSECLVSCQSYRCQFWACINEPWLADTTSSPNACLSY